MLEYSEYIEKYQRNSRSFHSTKLEIGAESALSLYEEMNGRMLNLEQNREIYHILFNSCITNTFRHLKKSAKFDLTTIQRTILHFKPYLLAEIIEKKTYYNVSREII